MCENNSLTFRETYLFSWLVGRFVPLSCLYNEQQRFKVPANLANRTVFWPGLWILGVFAGCLATGAGQEIDGVIIKSHVFKELALSTYWMFLFFFFFCLKAAVSDIFFILNRYETAIYSNNNDRLSLVSNLCLSSLCSCSKRERKLSGIPANFIQSENSIERRSCLLVNTQRAGSSCLLLCLVITTACSCGDIERSKGIASCKTDRKLAKTLTAALTFRFFLGGGGHSFIVYFDNDIPWHIWKFCLISYL